MVFWLDWLFGNPTRLAELAGYTMGIYGLLTCLIYIRTLLRYRVILKLFATVS